jgi:two-component system, LuxR family, sensor kinase FixL
VEREHEGLLAAILSTAVDSIIVIDRRGIVQSVNPATEKLFGYPAEDVVGNNVKMLMPTPYREAHDGYLHNYQETGVPKIIGIGREVIGQRNDGTTFPVHLAVSEMNVDGQKLFAGIVRDISDLKHAQQQLSDMNAVLEQRVEQRTTELHETQAELVRAEKLSTLGQVSGGIAHEIRNPLNAIKTSAYYLLNAKSLSPKKMQEHLQRIDKQVTLIDNVIAALTDIARLPEPKQSDCDLHEIVMSALENVSITPTITIVDRVDRDLPKVRVDANQIRIVFRNLLKNARDAMKEGGTITLRSEHNGQEVTLHVIDTGTGIAQEHFQHITEPLYSTKARGMGLGLAISKAILDKNHGRLEVESESGKGATFSVILEAAPNHEVE